MPRVRTTDGIDLHYVERGAGERTVVFSHSYLVDHRQFEEQIAALEGEFRVIAYDHRDHGSSGRATAPYALRDLVADAVAVIEHTDAAPCDFVGLSTGGFVGLRLALRHRELLRRLVLMDTSAQPEPWHHRLRYQGMFAVLRLLGMRPLIDSAMRSMFGRTSFDDASRDATLALWRERILDNDPRALIRFGNAIFGRDNVVDCLPSLSIPTLAMAGEHDIPTPPTLARTIARAIPGAQLEVLPNAGHLCTVEDPDAVNAHLVPFLTAP